MSMMTTLVRLRWTLTFATLRRSPWQVVGYVIGLLFAVGGIVGLTSLAIAVGQGPAMLGAEFEGVVPAVMFAAMTRALVIVAASFVTLFIIAVQLMIIGEGSTLSPGKFVLFGIPDRTLSAGLLAASLSGLPALAGTVALALWSPAYRWMGPVPVIGAIVAAPLAIVTIMSLCRLVIALSTSLVQSSRGRGAFYMTVMIAFILMCQIPNIMVNSGTTGDRDFSELAADLAYGVQRAADILSWTPLAAAFQLPFDLMSGAWLALIGRLAVLVVTWTLCFMGTTWCLRHDRLTVGQDTSSAVAKGIGAFAWMPDSPSGAVSARLLTYLKRDPRQSLMVVFPVLFVVIFALQSHGITIMVWQCLTWMGLFMMMTESNGLAYDGGGFTMQVLAGLKGRDDRFGRVRVFAWLTVGYLVVLALGIFLFTGDWRIMDGLATGLMCLMIGIGGVLAALGLAEVLSCVLMYPVPSIDKPFSSPQGRAAAQGFFPFVQMLGSVVAMAPTGIVALIVGLTAGIEITVWVTGPVALANGVGALLLGSWLGGKLLDARANDIVRTLEDFASLSK